MLWLILGIALGFTWHALIVWSESRNLRIPLLVWFLLMLTILDILSGVQNYVALNLDYEEQAARMIIPVYGVQAAIPLALALFLLWRKTRRARW